MAQFVPCPGCQRHVRTTERSCPFCSAALSLENTPAPVLPTTRLGRYATFAFGATIAGATALAACGGKSEESEDGSGSARGGAKNGGTNGGGTAGTNTGGTDNFGGGTVIYGAPPTGGTTGAGGTTDRGGTTGTGGVAQPYGVPPDAGLDSGLQPPYGFPPDDGGGAQPEYGAPPSDGGFVDDGGGAQPDYGSPPMPPIDGGR